ncbi:MAG: ABC transporter permease [Gammaproteobacteria bacterium]|nr:ABC transporter permease [Gammaproteobacteria bacterium]
MTRLEQIALGLTWGIALLVVVYLMLPLAVTIAVSFSSSPVFDLPPPQWSLRWYAQLARLRGLDDAVWLSLQIALICTFVSLLLGTACAIAVVRGNLPFRESVTTFMVSPLMMPGLVLGVALLQFLREMGLREAYPSLVIGHIIVTLPFVMRVVVASLSLFDFSLIDAARTLGCSYPKALFKVLVPALAPAFITSGLFAFLASMDNYPVSIFLTDARYKTLPIQMLQYLDERPDPTIAAISAGLIALTIVVLLIGDKMVGLKKIAEF